MQGQPHRHAWVSTWLPSSSSLDTVTAIIRYPLRKKSSRLTRDVDVSLAWLPFELEALAAADRLDRRGVTVPVARAEAW